MKLSTHKTQSKLLLKSSKTRVGQEWQGFLGMGEGFWGGPEVGGTLKTINSSRKFNSEKVFFGTFTNLISFRRSTKLSRVSLAGSHLLREKLLFLICCVFCCTCVTNLHTL